jgi:Fe-S-cluster containining protein
MLETSTWRPSLREGVEIEDRSLWDPLLDRRLRLGPRTAALVDALGAPLTEVLSATASAGPCTLDEAGDALRDLLRLNLVEGAAPEVVARLRDAAGPIGKPQVLPRARFGCAARGQCCRVYRPGPLTESCVAGLAEAESALRAAFPDLPPPPWIEAHPDEGGASRRYLRRIEGRCVFLRPDQRCGVHAVAGREAKPEVCRLFPFDAVRTLDGLRVFEVSQCSAFAVTSQQGELHSEAAPEVVRLASERPRLHHPMFLVAPGVPSDYGHLLPLEARLLELAETLPLATRWATCAAAAREHASALTSFPLEPGQPALTARAIRTWEGQPLATPEPGAAALALVAVGEALSRAMSQGEENDAPLADAFRDALEAATSLLAERAGLAEGPLPEVVARAGSLPLDLEETDAMLRRGLRNRLFGAKLLVAGRLRPGVLRIALLELLTVAGARLSAALEGSPRVEPRHLSAGHWAASLPLARTPIAAALVEVSDHADCLSGALPLLL